MIRIHVIVEGQTEETFVNEVLAPHFYDMGIYPNAILIGKPGHKGGVISYQRAKNDILRILKQDKEAYCTTMFDFYRLPADFPGMPFQGSPSSENKAKTIEKALYKDIEKNLSNTLRPDRFIPYIQMHEFEAILFSDPDAFARGIFKPNLEEQLREIRTGFNTPEDIDQEPNGAPSKRILKIFPGYEKVTHGSLAAIEIGLRKIKDECPNFKIWLGKIENLAIGTGSPF